MVASNLVNLPNRFFQPALSGVATGHVSGMASDRLGQLVLDAADIDQCIRIILTTPRGSNPHRPLFGSDLHLYIDYPVNSARPHIVREAFNALRAWEPRIEVMKVTVVLADVAALNCSVEWKFAVGLPEKSFVTNLALGVSP